MSEHCFGGPYAVPYMVPVSVLFPIRRTPRFGRAVGARPIFLPAITPIHRLFRRNMPRGGGAVSGLSGPTRKWGVHFVSSEGSVGRSRRHSCRPGDGFVRAEGEGGPESSVNSGRRRT